jgi:hypothetical protein
MDKNEYVEHRYFLSNQISILKQQIRNLNMKSVNSTLSNEEKKVEEEMKSYLEQLVQKKNEFVNDYKLFELLQVTAQANKTLCAADTVLDLNNISSSQRQNKLEDLENQLKSLENKLKPLENKLEDILDLLKESKQDHSSLKDSTILNYRREFPLGSPVFKNTTMNVDPNVLAYFNAFIRYNGLRTIEATNQAFYQYVKTSKDCEDFEKTFFHQEDVHDKFF